MKTLMTVSIAVITISLLALFIGTNDIEHSSHAFAQQTAMPNENKPAKVTNDGINVAVSVPKSVYATDLTPVEIKVTDAKSGKPLSHVDWAISVKDPHGNIVYKTTTGHSHSGTMNFSVAFPVGGQHTIALTSSSIGPKMMGMDVPSMARTHTMDSGNLMTFEKDPENNFGSRTFEFPVYVLPQKQTRIVEGSEPGSKVNVELTSTSNEIVAGQPATIMLTLTKPDGEMLTHPDALISVRKGSYRLSDSADPGDPSMPMNGAYHGHLGQMSYTATFPSAGNYVVFVDMNSLPISNLQFGQASARFNVQVIGPAAGETAVIDSTIPKNTVHVVGLEAPFYQPNNISVKTGTEIVFDNVDGNFHTVTSGSPSSGPDGKFDSGLMKAGDTYTLKLDKAGTYKYYCTIHTNMVGTVTVS